MARHADNSSWCGAINCSNSKLRNPELSFHRVPSDPTRSKKWVQYSRRADLLDKSVEFLHTNIKFCSQHFEPSQYHLNSKRLRLDALPTLFDVPNAPQQLTPKRPLRERQQPQTIKKPRTARDSTELKGSSTDPQWSGIADILGEEGTGGVTDVDSNDENVSQPKVRVPATFNRYRCATRRLRKENERLRSALAVVQKAASVKGILEQAKAYLNPKQLAFFKMQMEVTKKRASTRRYSDDQLIECLTLYYQGPRAYKYLRKQFVLPSLRSLRRRIEGIQVKPGFQRQVVNVLKDKFQGGEEHEKLVALSFDEMMVRPRMTYLRGADAIEGLEDFGALGKTRRLADHALVFMARGVTRRWKQPVGYFLSRGPAPAHILKPLLETCVREMRLAGFTVVCVVSDMGRPNQKLYEDLNVSAASPTFAVDGVDVIALHDVPHLVKCVRNTLLKHNITADGKTASWAHIRQFYAEDSKRPIRCAPKLTDVHISPEAFKLMKVRYATQVLSRTVASGMTLYSSCGLLDKEVTDTADFLLRINDVFDVCNSSTQWNPNPMKRALSKENENERRRMLQEVSEWLGSWKLKVNVPSVDGFRLTLAGLIALWDRYGGEPLEFLLTRRLNQDALENMFGVIRMSGGQNDLPDAVQFRMALRKASTSSLLLAPDSANCEPDGDSVLNTLTSVARRTDDTCPEQRATVDRVEGDNEFDLPLDVADTGDGVFCMPLDVGDANNLTYVGGYLLRRGSRHHSCDQCQGALAKPERCVVHEREILCALKSYTGATDVDVGSLMKPTESFHEVVVITYQATQTMAPSLLCRPGIASRVMSAVMSAERVKALEALLCERNGLREMLATFVRMQLHVMCKMSGPKLASRPKNKVNRKALKLSCRV